MKHSFSVWLAAASVALGSLNSSGGMAEEAPAPTRPTLGSVERLSPEFDRLVAPGVEMERLADGFNWSEGPTWLSKEKAIVFSDVPENKIYRWSDKDGLSVYLQPSGYDGNEVKFREQGSNGLTTDRAGKLVVCQHGNRRIARLLSRDGITGDFEPVVSQINGRRFNSPNDLCFARNGDLYFTDPPYGLEGTDKSPLKELMVNGVYLLRPKGPPVLLVSDLSFPNGIALSPDEKTLYVNVSDPQRPVVMAAGGSGAKRTSGWFEGRCGG
jgi:gluconolactonase